ncbi:LuxR C-terminal-related transcriptional regulator [Rhizobium etli]|uniref:LuxR C-terminal-related transcriptional regulator n=1 Tax=Rhizobium etli TaxID=29449 RepID=UPI00038395D2|nr:LuxR C-terminal-related transcriptional regulator [Rhizobium etli]AGS24430.1 hypothetical protein REMIM1_PC00074 [Rhizobium etli bv. mimosae str. Mim1]
MTTLILSPMERSCLRWLSLGWSVREIARLEGKSEDEIRLCLDGADQRLGATSLKGNRRDNEFNQ